MRRGVVVDRAKILPPRRVTSGFRNFWTPRAREVSQSAREFLFGEAIRRFPRKVLIVCEPAFYRAGCQQVRGGSGAGQTRASWRDTAFSPTVWPHRLDGPCQRRRDRT